MANSLHSTSIWVAAPTTAYNLATSIGISISKHIRIALKTLQTARMMSALAKLSDDQLFQMGISRSEIPEYAIKLLQDE